ncbi:MAG: cell envelope integrity protein TolA [Thiotrichaceae bacterium]|nr:cell envelope integrity protein TolA [Thiotrichaceae bacterium]
MYENFLAVIATLLFHAILALAFLLNLKQPSAVVATKQYEVIDAVAIDESKLLAILGSTKAIELKAELQKQWEQQQHLSAIRYAQLKQEEQRLEKIRLEQENAAELQRLKKLEQQTKILEQQHQQEQQRLAKLRQKQEKLKQQAKKAIEERKRLEQAKKAKAEQKRQADAKAEKKRQAEKLRKQQHEAKIAKEQKAKKQAELEHQRKKEAAKKAEIERQKQVARRQQAARETEIKRQIDAKRKAAQDQRISRIISLIQQRVQQQWQRPAHTSSDLTCRILVKLASDGAVTYAQVSVSSGHTAFDSSAIRAVYKASPLLIPKDLYDHFKTFTFTFRP